VPFGTGIYHSQHDVHVHILPADLIGTRRKGAITSINHDPPTKAVSRRM